MKIKKYREQYIFALFCLLLSNTSKELALFLEFLDTRSAAANRLDKTFTIGTSGYCIMYRLMTSEPPTSRDADRAGRKPLGLFYLLHGTAILGKIILAPPPPLLSLCGFHKNADGN